MNYVKDLAQRINNAQHITVVTGAGISAAAGIDTFRGVGTSISALRKAFNTQNWYTDYLKTSLPAWMSINKQVDAADPTTGHYALCELEKHLVDRGKKFSLITQNIDDLHNRAGSSRPLDIHGNITHAVLVDTPEGPRYRPDIVFFGESIRHREELNTILGATDVLIMVGTSGNVVPAANFPALVTTTYRNGKNSPTPPAVTALINAEPWDWADFPGAHRFDYTLIGTADDLLTHLISEVTGLHYPANGIIP